MKNNQENQSNVYKLCPLEDMDDWQVHSDDTDIRGWEVYTNDGMKVGKVVNLIADTELKKVRYAEIHLDDGISQFRDYSYRDNLLPAVREHYGREDHVHSIVPIGLLRIDEDEQKVIGSPNLKATHFSSSPRYAGVCSDEFTPFFEWLIVKYYADLDERDRKVYNEKKYDFEGFRATPYISDNHFYSSALFSRDRYLTRYQNNNTRMAGVNTGMPRR